MPCRLQPYIWISDDALAAAYRRFANTCRVNPRRHGSSVPGPLEARRRLARRRMAGMTMVGPSPGLMPDFGALFGSGGLDMTSLWSPPTSDPSRASTPPDYYSDPSPSSPHTLSEITKHPPSSRETRPSSRTPSLDEYRFLLVSCHTLDSMRQAHARLHPDLDVPPDFSQAAFRTLLRHSTHDQVVDFLQSDLNHESARNTHAYILHLLESKARSELISEAYCLACEKITLGTMQLQELTSLLSLNPTANRLDPQLLLDTHTMLFESLVEVYAPQTPPTTLILSLLENLLSVHQYPEMLALVSKILPLTGHQGLQLIAEHLSLIVMSHVMRVEDKTLLHSFLAAIPSQAFEGIVLQSTYNVISVIDTSEDLMSLSSCAKGFVRWFEDLYDFRAAIFQPSATFATLLFPILASKFTIVELGALLRKFHPADAATIILHHWIKPAIVEVPEPTSAFLEDQSLTLQSSPAHHIRPQMQDFFQTYGVRYTISRSTNKAKAHREPILTRQIIFDDIATTFQELCSSDKSGFRNRGAPWVTLFSLLSKNKIEYAGWLDQVFQVLKAYKSPTWTYMFFMKLTNRKVQIPYSLAVELMRFFIDVRKPTWAVDIFARPGAHQWISDVPELLFALVDTTTLRTDSLFKLINSNNYSNSLPMGARSTPRNPLSQEYARMVNHVAYAIAKSPLINSSMAFRRVKDCLHYLQDRGAPLSHMMSRALVHAGVTRPLREGCWLSTVKFQWILRFVREIEGDEIADKLDEAAFTIRSQNFEANFEKMHTMSSLELAADRVAWEYRKQFGHESHRWTKRTPPYKPAAPKKASSKGSAPRRHRK